MRQHLLATVALLGSLAGCAPLAPPPCPAGEQAVAVHTLYFGRNRPGGTVTPPEWQAFVDEFVTPRFMDGLTQWPARGQWRNIHTARIEREESFVLQLVVPAPADARPKVQALIDAYKSRFQQQAVLHVVGPACANL